MTNVVGIDLGTTFCAVATLNESGQAITLPNREGDMLTPSAVLISENLAVVGEPALDVAQERPENVATMFKRRMGLKEYDRLVDGRTFRPETLSAIVLKKLAQDAEQRLGGLSKVVITVPAYFDDTRRKATQDAGRIAGLDVLDVMDEPSAAALAYSFQQREGPLEAPLTDKPKIVLVYDLGGGTFDVTLVRLFPKKFQTLAIEGDVRLGGKDFDDRIINHVAEQFQAKFGQDPRKDPQTLAMLQASAERAKRTLSKLESSSVTCTHDGRKLLVPITRKDFENLTRDLLTRTRLTTQQVLKQAGVAWDQVDRVLLVGGSTHMPMTGQMLRDLSGKPVDNSLAVSEVVARGAALHAGILLARSKAAQPSLSPASVSALEDIVEISVNAHSLGVEIRSQGEKVNDILIRKNTQLPAAASRVYHTVSDGQSKVRVRVLQGEAHQSEACIQIGVCWIVDLPGDLPKGSPIQVRCGVQSNGMVEVMALDMTSGRMARTEIHRSSGLSDEEIAREAGWLKGLKIQ